MMNNTYLYRSIVMAVSALALSAQSQEQAKAAPAPQYGQPIELQPITIMGNTINDIDDTLPNVDVVNLNVLRNPDVSSLRDAVRKNPAVEINTDAKGNGQQLRIRGFGENYTEVTLDGQKMPAFFNFGPYTTGGRNFVETDTLKQIDIIKGLHSPKQSSGALAGSVNMQTYDPGDFVDADYPYYFSLQPSYTSDNRGFGATATAAGAVNNLSGMVIYTRRHYHEQENMGSDAEKTLRDKLNINQHNILAKGELDLEQGRMTVTGEYFTRKQETFPRYLPKAKSYTDPTKRARFAFDGTFHDIAGLDTLHAQASVRHYAQTTHVYGQSDFKQNNAGLQLDATKTLTGGNITHKLLMGVGYERDEFDYKQGERTGTVRYIPLTQRDNFTAYIKDQLTFGNQLSISPGVRVQHQRLHASVDEFYRNNPALPAQGGYIPHGSKTIVSPSINAVMPINEQMKIYASYAKGSKFADDNNIGSFDHGFGYIIPNPNLKNERSDNYELGFSYVQPEQFEFKLTGFYNRFHNFIEFERDGVFGVTSKGTPKMVMRPYNISKAKTYGVELESGYHINPQLYAHASLAWMRGRIGAEASHGVTLSQAYPQKAILGLQYHQGEQWGADVNWTLVGKGQKPEDTATQFRTPGFGTVDVTGWWSPVKNLTVTAGVYNLTNKKYWLSSDANGLRKVDRMGKAKNLDLFTQPGRNIAVNLRYEF